MSSFTSVRRSQGLYHIYKNGSKDRHCSYCTNYFAFLYLLYVILYHIIFTEYLTILFVCVSPKLGLYKMLHQYPKMPIQLAGSNLQVLE